MLLRNSRFSFDAERNATHFIQRLWVQLDRAMSSQIHVHEDWFWFFRQLPNITWPITAVLDCVLQTVQTRARDCFTNHIGRQFQARVVRIQELYPHWSRLGCKSFCSVNSHFHFRIARTASAGIVKMNIYYIIHNINTFNIIRNLYIRAVKF